MNLPKDRPPTVDELEAYCREQGTWEDIFTTTDLGLPPGRRVLRDRASIQRWLDALWGGVDQKKRLTSDAG